MWGGGGSRRGWRGGDPTVLQNSRLKGAVDRELGGEYIEKQIRIFDF